MAIGQYEISLDVVRRRIEWSFLAMGKSRRTTSLLLAGAWCNLSRCQQFAQCASYSGALGRRGVFGTCSSKNMAAILLLMFLTDDRLSQVIKQNKERSPSYGYNTLLVHG